MCICWRGLQRPCASSEVSHGGQPWRFRKNDDDPGQKQGGKRREEKRWLTVGCLLSSYVHGEDGDGEASTKFRGSRDGRGRNSKLQWLPMLGMDVIEEEELEAMTCVCSSEPDVLHGVTAA